MFEVKDYFHVAKANERVFRNILRDMRDNREKRTMGYLIPENLETEAKLGTFFQKLI